MKPELRILILEDEPADAELAVRELRKGGFVFSSQRVINREAFTRALHEFRPDVILADYSLPTFTGLEALAIKREEAPLVPFILVSGVMGEEFAIETLHQGAADYVLKSHLAKLGPAVTRALQTAEEHLLRQLAEEGLRRASAYNRSLIESSLDPLVTIGPDGKITDVNATTEAVTGYPRDALIGREFSDYFAEPDKAREVYQRVFREGSVRDYALEIRHRDGRLTPVLYNATLYRDENGKGVGVFAAARDITELRRTQSDLASSEEKFRKIAESAQDAFVTLDQEGRITYWNRAATRMFGYAEDEALGGDMHKLLVPARFYDAFLRGWPHFVETGQGPVVGKTQEFIATKKDGAEFPVELSISSMFLKGHWHAIGIIRDISKRVEGERALSRSNHFLKTLSRCNETLVHAADEQELLPAMCRVVVEVGEFPLAWIGYVEHDEAKSVRVMAQAGERAREYVSNLDITWADTEKGNGPTGLAVRSGQIQVAQDIATEARFAPWRARAIEYGYRASVSLPLEVNHDIIGTLNIYAAEANIFHEDEIRLLTELAGDLAYGIATLRGRVQQAESSRKLEQSLEDTIQAVATTIEARDAYTAGHQRRVAQLAAAIAREMGLPEERIVGIQRGAEIHDIGKIRIPAEILNRPGRLNVYETALIHTHPQVGCDIIKEIDFPWPLATMILQHHERLDGSGYPGGLKDSDIILEARILAVADVVEAMMTHRPYRAALELNAALEEIDRQRGRLYDPSVVDACLRLFREKKFAVAGEPQVIHKPT